MAISALYLAGLDPAAELSRPFARVRPRCLAALVERTKPVSELSVAAFDAVVVDVADAGQGRTLLEQQFQLSSRQQLSDEQLLHFNMLLESEWISASSRT